MNVCCFKPLKLLCSKSKQTKQIHNLVKRILSTWLLLTPTQDPLLLKYTGVGALIFSLMGNLKTSSPRSYWGLFTFPISGQSPTHPSRIIFPVKLDLQSPGRIRPISSVISETLRKTLIIIFRRSGSNFLFVSLGAKAKVNGKMVYKDKGEHPSHHHTHRTGAGVQVYLTSQRTGEEASSQLTQDPVPSPVWQPSSIPRTSTVHVHVHCINTTIKICSSGQPEV